MDQPTLLHTRESIRRIAYDYEKIKDLTGFEKKDFLDTVHDVQELVSKSKDGRLFRDIASRKADPGNRCKLSVREAVIMTVLYERTKLTQADIGVFFGIDQTTACRYRKVISEILAKVLPTAHRYSQLVSTASKEELALLVPDNIIIADGTETPVVRSGDAEQEYATLSGKKKMHTYSTCSFVTKDGVLMGLTPTHPGRMHDFNVLLYQPLPFGRVGHQMFKTGVPENEKINLYVDRGYEGLDEHFVGARIHKPYKKKPNRKLTARQKAHNKRVNQIRIGVEHEIGHMKNYKRLTEPFEGTEEEFNGHMNLITGLVNLKTFNRLGRVKKKKILDMLKRIPG